MNKNLPPDVQLAVELMELCTEEYGGLRIRRMFGGFGFYAGEHFFAIHDGERLYLKADTNSAIEFENANCTKFTYYRKDKAGESKAMNLNYYCCPPEALLDEKKFQKWGKLAIGSSIAAKTKKMKKKK